MPAVQELFEGIRNIRDLSEAHPSITPGEEEGVTRLPGRQLHHQTHTRSLWFSCCSHNHPSPLPRTHHTRLNTTNTVTGKVLRTAAPLKATSDDVRRLYNDLGIKDLVGWQWLVLCGPALAPTDLTSNC